MLEKLKAFAEKHPMALGAIVLIFGLILIYAMHSSSGSAAASGSSSGLSAAELQAASQMAQLQAQQQAQSNQLAVAQSMQQAQIQGQVQLATIGANTQLGVAGMQTATQQQAQTLAAQTTQQNTNLSAQLQWDQIQSSAYSNYAQLQALMSMAHPGVGVTGLSPPFLTGGTSNTGAGASSNAVQVATPAANANIPTAAPNQTTGYVNASNQMWKQIAGNMVL